MKNSNLVTKVLEGVMDSLENSSIHCPNCKTYFSFKKDLLEPGQFLQLEKDINKEFLEQADSIAKERLELEKKIKDMDFLVEKNALEKIKAMEKELKENIEREVSSEMAVTKEAAEKANQELEAKRKSELELLRKVNELELEKRRAKTQSEIEFEEKRKELEEMAVKEASENYNRLLAQKDKQLEDLRKQSEEMRRKATTVSQQLQGEVLELSLEATLRNNFPEDEIEEVKKGVNGADVIQTVRTTSGMKAGVISHEFKDVKNFKNDYIAKLKKDVMDSSHDIGVISTTVFPSDVKGPIAFHEGVWICSPEMVVPLVTALRIQLIKVQQTKALMANNGDKAKIIYEYLISPQFAQQITSIMENHAVLLEDLDAEKKVMTRNWKRREAGLGLVRDSVINVIGTIQMMVGKGDLHIPLIDSDLDPIEKQPSVN
jgi:hypothetical protein